MRNIITTYQTFFESNIRGSYKHDTCIYNLKTHKSYIDAARELLADAEEHPEFEVNYEILTVSKYGNIEFSVLNKNKELDTGSYIIHIGLSAKELFGMNLKPDAQHKALGALTKADVIFRLKTNY